MNTKNSFYIFLVLAAFEMYAILQTIEGFYLTQWFLILSAAGIIANSVALYQARKDRFDITAPVLGIVAHLLAWILLLGWTLHFAAFVAYIWGLIEKTVLRQPSARRCGPRCMHKMHHHKESTKKKLAKKKGAIISTKKNVGVNKKASVKPGDDAPKKQSKVKNAREKEGVAKGNARVKKSPAKTIKKSVPQKIQKNVGKVRKPAAQKKKSDDLTKIEGVGPKTQEILKQNKINTFSDLARKNVHDVQEILNNNNLHRQNARTWGQQAKLARDAKWTELKNLQKSLHGGRKK